MAESGALKLAVQAVERRAFSRAGACVTRVGMVRWAVTWLAVGMSRIPRDRILSIRHAPTGSQGAGSSSCSSSCAVAGGYLLPAAVAADDQRQRDRVGVSRTGRDRARRRRHPAHLRRPQADALFGLGYVHAQDRLWQMEFQRRIGHGRLSEIFGAATLPQDRFLRTVGFGRAARSAWEHLPRGRRTQIDAYVAGVNAFIAAIRAAGCRRNSRCSASSPSRGPAPDVLVWVKMMAWDLSANYSLELLRHDIAGARRARADCASCCRPIPPTASAS